MITKLVRVSCIRETYGTRYRVRVPKSLIDQCVDIAEAVRKGVMVIGIYDVEFVAKVTRRKYTKDGKVRNVYYVTIPKKYVDAFRIRCGDYIEVRYYGYGERV